MPHAIYRRASTDDQENSLEIQEAKCLAYAVNMNNGEQPEVFSDPGTSGGIPIWQRKGGAALVQAIDAGRIDCVTIAKFDRIGRRARDWHNFSHHLEKHHIQFHIVDLGGAPLAAHGFAGKMLLGILAQLAEFELEMIRQRTQDTMDKLFTGDRLIGTVPYGWDVDGDGHLVPNDAEIHVILRMMALRSSGMGYEAIATQLNRDGIPTKRGAGVPVKRHGVIVGHTSGLWKYTTVKTVLESRHVREKLCK